MESRVKRILQKLSKDEAANLKKKLDQAEKDVDDTSSDLLDLIGKLEFSTGELYRDSYYLDDLYEQGKKDYDKTQKGLKVLNELDLDTSVLTSKLKELSNQVSRAKKAADSAKKLADQLSGAISGFPI